MEQWEALVAAAAGIESALAALGPAALDAPLVEAEAVKVESVKAEGDSSSRDGQACCLSYSACMHGR